MAVQEQRICDIFPPREAKPYALTLKGEPGNLMEREYQVDLSDRAFYRLVKFIERGLSKPGAKKGGAR